MAKDSSTPTFTYSEVLLNAVRQAQEEYDAIDAEVWPFRKEEALKRLEHKHGVYERYVALEAMYADRRLYRARVRAARGLLPKDATPWQKPSLCLLCTSRGLKGLKVCPHGGFTDDGQ